MLDAIEEALDLVAEFVDARTEGGRVDAAIERANVGIGPALSDLGTQSVAVVASISQQNAIRSKRAEHLGAYRSVVCLPLGQLERDREAVAVDDRVDLGRKPAAGAAHATTSTAFFSPLAACWCTRTTELSIIWIWPA